MILRNPSCKAEKTLAVKLVIPSNNYSKLYFTIHCAREIRQHNWKLSRYNQYFPIFDWWVLIMSHLGGRGCVSSHNWLCALPKHHSHLTAEWVKQIRLRGEKQPHLFPITPALLSWGIQLLTVHILHVHLFNMDCEATVHPSDPNLTYCDLFFQGKKPWLLKTAGKNGLKGFPLFIHSR